MKKKWILFLSLALAFSSQGFAKGKKAEKSNKAAHTHEAPVKGVEDEMLTVNLELPLNNDETYNKFLEEIKKSPRSTAAAIVDVPAIEKKFENDFFEMRAELIGNGIAGDKNEKGIVNTKQLDTIIDKYSRRDVYNSLSNQSKFVALQLRALKPFKSFIFRAKHYIGGISATRTMIVTALRTQIAGIQSFFPISGNPSVNHWEVVFNYITQNSDDMGPEINTDDDLYKFFKNLTAHYSGIVTDLGNLVVSKDAKPIWWDNKLYMSFANFSSEKDRYALLGKPELHAIYSAALLNLSTLYSTTAYSFNGLQSSIKSVGQLFGINDIGDLAKASKDGAEGMSSYSRIKVLRSHKDLFQIVSDGKDRMRKSYDLLQSSARAARISFEESKKLPEGQENLFDPRVANAFNRIGSTSFANIDQLVDEKNGDVTSTVVNGERVKVSLKYFYHNPPENLRELYPTNWDLSWEEKVVNAPGYKHTKLRNYKYGMATEWNLDAYQKLFPEIKGYNSRTTPKSATTVQYSDVSADGNNKTNEVPKYARILSQTWGSAIFAIPLGAAIF